MYLSYLESCVSKRSFYVKDFRTSRNFCYFIREFHKKKLTDLFLHNTRISSVKITDFLYTLGHGILFKLKSPFHWNKPSISQDFDWLEHLLFVGRKGTFRKPFYTDVHRDTSVIKPLLYPWCTGKGTDRSLQITPTSNSDCWSHRNFRRLE